MKTYHLGDSVHHATRTALIRSCSTLRENDRVVIRAIRTGDFGKPRAGEWFLSGAHSIAYRAAADMLAKHIIVQLVVVRRVITWEIVK